MRAACIVVACAEHVARGRTGGFVQVCHGKEGTFRRIAPGDGVACYSPTAALGRGPPLRAFTAVGVADDREPYRFDMGGGFVPWRRDVRWAPAAAVAPIAPLLPALRCFADAGRGWGARLRFGLVRIVPEDFAAIAAAMGAAAERAAA